MYKMKFRVNKRTLLITAGTLWVIAGANVLAIGIDTWIANAQPWHYKALGAVAIYLLFFLLIFNPLYRKHALRISLLEDSNLPTDFFDTRGWIVMGGMMSMGLIIRKLHLLPEFFIAFFYTGLSTALITTGIRFLIRSRQHPSTTKPPANRN